MACGTNNFCAFKMLLNSGHEATLLEGGELAQQQRDFTGYKDGLVRFSPGGWLFTKKFTKFANGYYNFKVVNALCTLIYDYFI